MVKSLRTLLVVISTIASRVLSQSSNVTHCIPEYQWSINSRGQTPCLVGAYLESICSGIPTIVNELPLRNHYLGPTFERADPCLCNSVTYSVISACGGCQGRIFINYTTWTINCPRLIQIGQFPRGIPDVIELPSWASLNISLTKNTFDPLAAEREAERANAFPSPTSSTGPVPGTTNFGTPSTLLPTPSLTPGANNTLPLRNSGGLGSGAIAGITVGAIVAVVIVVLLIFWMTLRAKRRRNSKPGPLKEPFNPFNDKPQAPLFPPVGHEHTRSLSDPASIAAPYTYSASQIDRQPVSPGSSTYYTTAPGRGSFENVISPQTLQSPNSVYTVQTTAPSNPPGLRGYTGAAEI